MPTTLSSSELLLKVSTSVLLSQFINFPVHRDHSAHSRHLRLWETLHPSLGDRYRVSSGDIEASSRALVRITFLAKLHPSSLTHAAGQYSQSARLRVLIGRLPRCLRQRTDRFSARLVQHYGLKRGHCTDDVVRTWDSESRRCAAIWIWPPKGPAGLAEWERSPSHLGPRNPCCCSEGQRCYCSA